MELPQEIELWYVIPSIRKALVTELKKQNLKQKDIAALLGITGPAISQYLKDKRASHCYEAFQKSPLKDDIKRSAKTIAEQKSPDPSIAIKEINRLCRIIRKSKVICEIHRKQNPKMKSCDICYED
jgi:predicted transcriptional regulator